MLYEYQSDRKKEHPKEFLTGFRGYLHTDGYAGYHDLPESITVVGCRAHARRYFDEAVKSLPKGKRAGSSAATGLAYCTKLFQEEKKLAELPPEERYKKRLELEKPVLERPCSHGRKAGRPPLNPHWARRFKVFSWFSLHSCTFQAGIQIEVFNK